jgi:CubicO group peptidase (beta-lactamase class C family)
MKNAILLFACFSLGACAQPAAKPGAVDALFRAYDQPSTPGASVAVIRDGKVLYQHAYGLADVEDNVHATTATNYRLASVTKQFTAMAILILAGRKLLSLDSTLSQFFPDFPAYGKGITVRELLNHTSGLWDYGELVPKERTAQLTDIDVLNLLKQQTATYFPPGSEWRYSNTSYAFLALIAEKVSGMRFAAFLKREIFDPLGMSGSVAFEEGVSTVRDRAYGYSESEHGFPYASL